MQVKVSCDVTGGIDWCVEFDKPVPDFQEGLNNGQYVIVNKIVFCNRTGTTVGKVVVAMYDNVEHTNYVVS